METHIIAFLEAIFDGKIAADVGLSVVIIIILYLSYKYIFKGMLSKLEEIPSKKELKQSLDDKTKEEEELINDLQEKLDKLIEKLNNVEDLSKNNYRESKELRRDIENIKQILNQFQGHMLYGSQRRSEDFGNRELK